MTDLTPERRQEIAARYSPPVPLACPVCGVEREIGSHRWGNAKWACYSKAPGGGFHDPEHHADSIFEQDYLSRDVPDLLAALEAAEARADAAEARVKVLEAACYEDVPDGVFSFSGMSCRLCGYDVSPDVPEEHEKSCLLFDDGLRDAQPAPGGGGEES